MGLMSVVASFVCGFPDAVDNPYEGIVVDNSAVYASYEQVYDYSALQQPQQYE
jgi:hypothetical protein